MNRIKYWLPLLSLTGLLLVLQPTRLTAQDTNQAALIVDYGDGKIVSKCVTFPEPEITGYELLLRSGLEVVADVQGQGALMCGIDGTGCPANDCLCECAGGSDCVYWSYWHRIDGNWQYSAGGASAYPVLNGAVEGWTWGPGTPTEAIAPPEVSFEDICQGPVSTSSEALIGVPATPVNEPAATTRDSFGSESHSSWVLFAILSVILTGIVLLVLFASRRKNSQ